MPDRELRARFPIEVAHPRLAWLFKVWHLSYNVLDQQSVGVLSGMAFRVPLRVHPTPPIDYEGHLVAV